MSSDKSGVWFARAPNASYSRLRPTGGKISLLIVDDHAPYRKGLRSMFELEPDIEVLGEASDGSEAIDKVEQLYPDIVLMDVNMPDMDGMQATRKLADAYPGILVITLTMFKGEEHLREARRAGASAYVLKDAGSEVLLETIRNVMSGETPLLHHGGRPRTGSAGDVYTTRNLEGEGMESPDTAQTNTDSLITEALLTSNERSILVLLAQGLSNDRIAQQTGLSEAMVRTYLSEVYRKMNLPGRDAAVQYAREHGFGEE
jgi:DNA-binding NarL/FixJ family response regulator